MDSGIRNLEEIREREPADGSLRRTAMIAIASAACAGLVIALAIVVGEASEPVAADPSDDPLALLDQASELQKAALPEAPESEEASVEREALTFPEALAHDERPEVHSALAAAAAEYEHPDPLGDEATNPATGAMQGRATLSQVLPAAVGLGPDGGHLARAAQTDPMVAAALPAPALPTTRSPEGRDGRYTLQVISYRTRAEADLFAETLRGKGHPAFVTVGDVIDRGTFYRVRVGPFESMAEARAYRSQFESAEAMNTFVVRQREPIAE